MKRWLRISAILLAGCGLAVWAVLGFNRGWTKSTATRWVKDPVTEIEGPMIEKRFSPGVDLLAVNLCAAAALFGGSFLVPQSKSKTSKSSTAISTSKK